MSTWVEDIVQALKNLGGQATNNEICNEVKRIRRDPLPNSWRGIVIHTIGDHSSDSVLYKGGQDLFVKIDNGIWALRPFAGQTIPAKKTSTTLPRKVSFQNFLPPESLDEISNILQTIKQYRDYQSPGVATWREYIKEIFHILGFNTEQVNPRLMTLNVMGSHYTPRAMVGLIHPGENFEEIVPGLLWESYLLFAANYYQINWGILTDGLQLKIIHYQDQEIKYPTYWPDFDGVVLHEKLDTFCTIYKVFSYIKGDGKNQV